MMAVNVCQRLPLRGQSAMRRTILLIVGLASVGLAVVGIWLPLLPTTPFLLLAAYCLARSSPRFHHWLLSHRVLGGYIKAYRQGRLDARSRWRTIALLWLSLAASALALDPEPKLLAALAAVGFGVSWHLLTLRPRLVPRPGAGLPSGAVETNQPEEGPGPAGPDHHPGGDACGAI